MMSVIGGRSGITSGDETDTWINIHPRMACIISTVSALLSHDLLLCTILSLNMPPETKHSSSPHGCFHGGEVFVISSRVSSTRYLGTLEAIAKCQRFPSSSCSPTTYVFRCIRTSPFLAFSLHSSIISSMINCTIAPDSQRTFNTLDSVRL